MSYTGQILGKLTRIGGKTQPGGNILISNREYWELRRMVETVQYIEDMAALAIQLDKAMAANLVAMIENGEVASP